MNEVSEDQALPSLRTADGRALNSDNSSFGAQLKSAREHKNWSVQFVAEQLKLSQSQILALEANDLDKLPKLVIVRGFIRAYAKLLKIDANPLVALLPQDSEPVMLETSLRPALSTPFVESRTSLSGQQDNNLRYLIGLCILVVIVAVIVFFQRTEYGQSIQTWMFGGGAKPSANVEVSASTPELTTPVNAASASNATQTVDRLGARNDSIDAAASATLQSQVLSAPTSSIQSDQISSSASASNVESLPPGGAGSPMATSMTASAPNVTAQSASMPIAESDALVLRFKQDSWIFVKSENGKVLSSHMAKAGTEEIFSAKQGLFLKVGNAAGVEANLRGRPFPIVADRDSKVANINVK